LALVAVVSEEKHGDFVMSTGKKYESSNDPRLLKRHLKRAQVLATSSGFTEELEEFERQCAAFPRPAELHFAM